MTPSLRRLAAATALALLLPVAAPAQIWSEEFDVPGAPDAAVWSYDLGGGGWGNNELQTYTQSPENVRVENGQLVITARRSRNGFTSARLRTQDKLTFQYGTVEARISVPDLPRGLWPAFWTLGNSFGSVGWPDCGEIDVLEMGAGDALASGVANRRVYSTAHWEFQGSHAQYGQSQTIPYDLDTGFHTWRMEWTPTAISTFVDGRWIWTMDISNPSSFDGQEFHAPHFFILNLAVGGNFPGVFDPRQISAPLPAEYRIDWVRIYDNGHTRLGGSSLRSRASAQVRIGAGNLNTALSSTAPVLGTTMTTVLRSDGQPYWFGGVIGFTGALDRPFGGFTQLVDMDSVPILTLPFTPLLAGGQAQWTVPIPSSQALAGLEVKTQGVLFGTSLALSNAVDLRLGY